MKQESQIRQRSADPPDRTVWSSTEVQKQVGQTIVQLPQDRQRLGDVVPARVLGVVVEQVADVGGVHAAGPSGATARVDDLARPRPSSAAGCRPRASRSSTAAPRSLPGRDEEPVLAVEQLGQREVVARVRARAGAHRHAEAGAARVGADDGDEEGGLAPGGVAGVRVRAGPAAPGRGWRPRAGRRSGSRSGRTAGRPTRLTACPAVRSVKPSAVPAPCQTSSRDGNSTAFQLIASAAYPNSASSSRRRSR